MTGQAEDQQDHRHGHQDRGPVDRHFFRSFPDFDRVTPLGIALRFDFAGPPLPPFFDAIAYASLVT